MELAKELTNEQIIQLWFHYEEIAMHFNELIIQYRLQLFAALGALGALFSYLINKDYDENKLRWVRTFISTSLLFIFIAAAALDLFYYYPLLEGAVTSIIELEQAYPDLKMSIYIKNQFSGIPPFWRITIVYLTIIIPFIIFTVWSCLDFLNNRPIEA